MKILIIFLFFNFSVFAVQSAIVRSSRAVVYADIYLKSPIGYLTRGKEIIVGKRKRLNDKVIPTVIERKVVWMKVDDLILESEKSLVSQNKTVTEHVAFIQEEELEEENRDPYLENNYLRFKYGRVSPSIGQGDEGIGGGHSLTSETLTGSEISAYIEHRHPLKRWNWGAGYSYSQFDSGLVKYEIPNFMVGTGYVLSKHNFINVELIAHLLLSMDVRVESIGVGEYQGSGYGVEFGPLVRFRTYKKTGLVLSALFKRSRLINLRTVENALSTRKDHLSTFSDFALFAGLSFEL
jgi:hypothetical protein